MMRAYATPLAYGRFGRATLRHAVNFAAGVLIGSMIVLLVWLTVG